MRSVGFSQVDAQIRVIAEGSVFASQRKSLWFRLTALGFIYLIVLGNIWLALLMVNAPVPAWLAQGFLGGVGFVFICAVVVSINTLRAFLAKREAGS